MSTTSASSLHIGSLVWAAPGHKSSQHGAWRRRLVSLPCRSFYYAGAFSNSLELFHSQLVSGQPDGGLFDRFLIQCMLFHHGVLTCSSYKGTSGAFELSSAARSQVRPVPLPWLGACSCGAELMAQLRQVPDQPNSEVAKSSNTLLHGSADWACCTQSMYAAVCGVCNVRHASVGCGGNTNSTMPGFCGGLSTFQQHKQQRMVLLPTCMYEQHLGTMDKLHIQPADALMSQTKRVERSCRNAAYALCS